jgi:hypothetical protein
MKQLIVIWYLRGVSECWFDGTSYLYCKTVIVLHSSHNNDDIYTGWAQKNFTLQNDTENKCGVLRTSHLHQSIEKLSKFCTHFTETRYVLREPHGRCRDDNPTRPKLCAISLVMEAMAVVIRCLLPGVNGYSAGWFHVKLCAKCTLHSCYRLFLRLTAEHTISSVVG